MDRLLPTAGEVAFPESVANQAARLGVQAGYGVIHPPDCNPGLLHHTPRTSFASAKRAIWEERSF